jgi:hypothetical protein
MMQRILNTTAVCSSTPEATKVSLFLSSGVLTLRKALLLAAAAERARATYSAIFS